MSRRPRATNPFAAQLKLKRAQESYLKVRALQDAVAGTGTAVEDRCTEATTSMGLLYLEAIADYGRILRAMPAGKNRDFHLAWCESAYRKLAARLKS